MRNYCILISIIGLIFWLNILTIPDDREFIPPEHYYLSDLFSYKLWHYRNQPAPDILLMGNSRSNSGLDPAVIARTLSQKLCAPVTVGSLSIQGGFFPFYFEVVRTLIADRPPKMLVLGVSPRDFNSLEIRSEEVRIALASTSGHQLDGLPYHEPFLWMEKKFTDLYAAFLPGLYYRTHLKSLFFKNYSSKSEGLLDRYQGQLRGMIPMRADWKHLFSSQRLKQNFSLYLTSIAFFFHWRPDPTKHVEPNGSLIIPAESQPQRQERLIAQQEEFARFRKDERQLRHGDVSAAAKLADSESAAHMRFFEFLRQRGVDVYLVLLPAIKMEGYENNITFNTQLTTYLRSLPSRFSNIKGVIDINNAFQHPFMQFDYYSDLEHLSPKGADLVSEQVGQNLAGFLEGRICSRQ